MIHFTIPGAPVPWARARHGPGRHWTPAKQASHKEHIKVAAAQALIRYREKRNPHWVFPLNQAVLAGFAFYLKKPKTRQARDLYYPAQRPDLDNYGKLVADSLQGIIYKDDSQIVGWLPWPLSGKHYSESGKFGRTEVYILPLADLSDHTLGTLFDAAGVLRRLE